MCQALLHLLHWCGCPHRPNDYSESNIRTIKWTCMSRLGPKASSKNSVSVNMYTMSWHTSVHTALPQDMPCKFNPMCCNELERELQANLVTPISPLSFSRAYSQIKCTARSLRMLPHGLQQQYKIYCLLGAGSLTQQQNACRIKCASEGKCTNTSKSWHSYAEYQDLVVWSTSVLMAMVRQFLRTKSEGCASIALARCVQRNFSGCLD